MQASDRRINDRAVLELAERKIPAAATQWQTRSSDVGISLDANILQASATLAPVTASNTA
jgi:hypothetical protein